MSIQPARGSFCVAGSPVTIRVEVDEPLSEVSIDGRAATLVGPRAAEASVVLRDAGRRVLPIVAKDAAGNPAAIEDYALTCARVPDGLEPLADTTLDAWGQGWATPLSEPRSGIVLRLVPPSPEEGFLLGALGDDLAARPNEKPSVRVRIRRAFYVGESEVTREQWDRLRGRGGDALPALLPNSWLLTAATGKRPKKLASRRFDCSPRISGRIKR